MPSSEAVERALEQTRKGQAHYRYFFSKLASPDWIGPLDKRDFFSSPPPAVREGDMIGFPFWPESEYLARMAPEAPQQVAAVMARIPETDNELVHEHLAKAAAGLPSSLAARWAEREADWVCRQERLYFLLPDALGGLAAHLAREGETAAAMWLACALLQVRLVDETRGEARARFDSWRYERVLQTYILELVQHSGLEGLGFLCGLLEDVLPAGAAGGDGWRRAVGPYGPPRGRSGDPVRALVDLRHALVDAVRDGSLRLVEAGVGIGNVVGLLQTRGRPIFERIALHFLSEKCGEHFEAAAGAVLDSESFHDENLWREYSRLLAAVFPRLDGSEKAKILGWVRDGPADALPGGGTEEQHQGRAARWHAGRLAVLRGHLPPEWEQRYEGIVAEFGKPAADSYPSAVVSGPRSPVEERELERMPVEEISSFLKTWRPSGELFAPDAGGLGRAFRSVVGGSPDRFLGSLDLFRGVEPAYARALVEGLEDAVKQDVPVEWDEVLGYLDWIAGQPRALRGETESGPAQDTPRWGHLDRDLD